MNRCDICIEEDCKGLKNCNCETCENRLKCNKFLHPTIRITTKCTQSCSHCGFSCSPKKKDMMDIEMAENISKFILNNNIKSLNLMGGEFYMNPHWYLILSKLVENVLSARLVTNGDWATNEYETEKVIEFFKNRNHVKLSISKDKWHTNKNVDKAEQICIENNIPYNVANDDQVTNESVVPIGRGAYHYNMYSFFSCYCHNPEHKYSFLIDEKGEIYKCSFGVWAYDNISNFIDGGFAERFKDFNKKFYSCFVSNCSSCLRMYQFRKVQ